MRTYRVYALVDPRTGGIRYVGSTAKQLAHRLTDHISSKHGKAPRHRWIKELHGLGLRPEIRLLQEVEVEVRLHAHWEEQRWIQRLRDDGHNLLNKPATLPKPK